MNNITKKLQAFRQNHSRWAVVAICLFSVLLSTTAFLLFDFADDDISSSLPEVLFLTDHLPSFIYQIQIHEVCLPVIPESVPQRSPPVLA